MSKELFLGEVSTPPRGEGVRRLAAQLAYAALLPLQRLGPGAIWTHSNALHLTRFFTRSLSQPADQLFPRFQPNRAMTPGIAPLDTSLAASPVCVNFRALSAPFTHRLVWVWLIFIRLRLVPGKTENSFLATITRRPLRCAPAIGEGYRAGQPK